MKATKSAFTEGVFHVVDGDKSYTVDKSVFTGCPEGRICAEYRRNGRSVFVGLDRKDIPQLAKRIDAAVAAA